MSNIINGSKYKRSMPFVMIDMEGVITPEIWIGIALSTGIDELKLTTRDIPDYSALMERRLKILLEHNITLPDIQNIIKGMDLLKGAREFLDWLRSQVQMIIVSDTFMEFSKPFIEKLGYPTILCHNLVVNEGGIIIDYQERVLDQKKKTALCFKMMNYEIIAIGDSYNDIGMIQEAKHGIFFRPPERITEEYSEFPVVHEYSQLKDLIISYLKLDNKTASTSSKPSL
ncbi:MAG: Phosphoserine phosphatase ThrH [Promethearchaeota archaeon]|nr:MAG: Phosphoserine phosphatase ThrH [Candidatus Lokiarchaeota archaeon]